jgi:UDP-N-acetylmuramoyl-L-alanyl-D-glutamate--2,6-diaminopimelate ligase
MQARTNAAAQCVLAAANLRATTTGLSFDLQCDGRVLPIVAPLVGEFNVANLLGVIGVLLACGITFEKIPAWVSQLAPPPGRMQCAGGTDAPLVIIDYAHTPDALEQALRALRPLAVARHGKLWTVFGAGGDRDRGKRASMGRVAAQLADGVVLTSDNPRSEEPARILADIADGIGGARAFRSVVDRAQAIADAIRQADARDVVLVAGKGHEPYQDIGGVKRPFSDEREVRAALAARTAKSGEAMPC